MCRTLKQRHGCNGSSTRAALKKTKSLPGTSTNRRGCSVSAVVNQLERPLFRQAWGHEWPSENGRIPKVSTGGRSRRMSAVQKKSLPGAPGMIGSSFLPAHLPHYRDRLGRPITRPAYVGRPGGLRTGSPSSPPPRLIRPTVRRLPRSPRLSGPGPHRLFGSGLRRHRIGSPRSPETRSDTPAAAATASAPPGRCQKLPRYPFATVRCRLSMP